MKLVVCQSRLYGAHLGFYKAMYGHGVYMEIHKSLGALYPGCTSSGVGNPIMALLGYNHVQAPK